MTYEGGGSVNGAFMGSLGASAAIISVVARLGRNRGYPRAAHRRGGAVSQG